MANRNQSGQDQGSQNRTQQSSSQQASSQKSSSEQAQNAGRERNTMGQTESPTSYWRNQYQNEPYYSQGQSFDQYEPAYRTGAEGRSQYSGQRFEEVESNLRSEYETNHGSSTMSWDQGAKQACRAAWDRADQMSASDRDRQSSSSERQSSEQSSDRKSNR